MDTELAAMIKRLGIFVLLWIAADLYFYQGLRLLLLRWFAGAAGWLPWAYALPDLAVLSALGLLLARPRVLQQRPALISGVFGYLVISMVPKLAGSLLLLASGMVSLVAGPLEGHGAAFVPLWNPPASGIIAYCGSLVSATGAAVLALSILYGMLLGGYRYKVRRAVLSFPELPEAFDGLRITQLSDIHCGSFRRRAAVCRGIELANAQQSDLLVFTGDMVNNQACELEGWTDLFARLRAPMGCYSILGNHDYGDYISWPDAASKAQNLQRLKTLEAQMGFRLLENEHLMLERSGQQLALIGVENWGKGRFHKHGDLHLALEGLPEGVFSILLSHDPSHWDEVVSQGPYCIPLTLSGHTHGMQFGLEWGRLRWSPVQYLYPQWAGLYRRANRYLYVNRGFGFLGFPGRVGIRPEITVLELRRG